jgi:hypothetical protein
VFPAQKSSAFFRCRIVAQSGGRATSTPNRQVLGRNKALRLVKRSVTSAYSESPAFPRSTTQPLDILAFGEHALNDNIQPGILHFKNSMGAREELVQPRRGLLRFNLDEFHIPPPAANKWRRKRTMYGD